MILEIGFIDRFVNITFVDESIHENVLYNIVIHLMNILVAKIKHVVVNVRVSSLPFRVRKILRATFTFRQNKTIFFFCRPRVYNNIVTCYSTIRLYCNSTDDDDNNYNIMPPFRRMYVEHDRFEPFIPQPRVVTY